MSRDEKERKQRPMVKERVILGDRRKYAQSLRGEARAPQSHEGQAKANWGVGGTYMKGDPAEELKKQLKFPNTASFRMGVHFSYLVTKVSGEVSNLSNIQKDLEKTIRWLESGGESMDTLKDLRNAICFELQSESLAKLALAISSAIDQFEPPFDQEEIISKNDFAKAVRAHASKFLDQFVKKYQDLGVDLNKLLEIAKGGVIGFGDSLSDILNPAIESIERMMSEESLSVELVSQRLKDSNPKSAVSLYVSRALESSSKVAGILKNHSYDGLVAELESDEALSALHDASHLMGRVCALLDDAKDIGLSSKGVEVADIPAFVYNVISNTFLFNGEEEAYKNIIKLDKDIQQLKKDRPKMFEGDIYSQLNRDLYSDLPKSYAFGGVAASALNSSLNSTGIGFS